MIPANVFGFRLSSNAGVSELSMGFLNAQKFTGKIRYYPMSTLHRFRSLLAIALTIPFVLLVKDPYYNDRFTYYQLGQCSCSHSPRANDSDVRFDSRLER